MPFSLLADIWLPVGRRGTTTRSAASRTLRQALRPPEISAIVRPCSSLGLELGSPPCACLHVVNQLVRYVIWLFDVRAPRRALSPHLQPQVFSPDHESRLIDLPPPTMWPFKTKRDGFPELSAELLLLCEAWFDRQIGDLPDDELPPKEEIEEDIIQMRDGVYERVLDAVPTDRFLDDAHRPDNERNQRALEELRGAYVGHESTTPIFVALALSKVDEPRYQHGWPLAAVRLVAEAWLEQSTT